MSEVLLKGGNMSPNTHILTLTQAARSESKSLTGAIFLDTRTLTKQPPRDLGILFGGE